MTCQCGNHIDETDIYCNVCGKFVFYAPVDDIRRKITNVLILVLIIAFFGWLMVGCKKVEYCSDMRTIPAPKPNPAESYFKSGECRYVYYTDTTKQVFLYKSGCGCKWMLIDSTITKL